jgi:hypothetical protein
MNVAVDSTNRTPKDYFHFGLMALGEIFCAAGIVIVSWRTVVCGLVLLAFGMAYFALED